MSIQPNEYCSDDGGDCANHEEDLSEAIEAINHPVFYRIRTLCRSRLLHIIAAVLGFSTVAAIGGREFYRYREQQLFQEAGAAARLRLQYLLKPAHPKPSKSIEPPIKSTPKRKPTFLRTKIG